ncbi:MAG: hypothetical protein IT165_21080 [Bryobacterales bacterium]|nr:hypothetical protein [Bryobacterales bacterium]
MTPVDLTLLSEPAVFDARCRKPGQAWLAQHPEAKRPKDYWSPFKPNLADGFRNLCAYTAMYEPIGTVDHFKSLSLHPDLAYEWSNYRYASAWVNSCKSRAGNILDPLIVEEGWFEILLPSLQLVLTGKAPEEHRILAEETVRRLRLRDDERVIRQRREWYRMYQDGELSFDGLSKKAPLIAQAVSRARAIIPSSDDVHAN